MKTRILLTLTILLFAGGSVYFLFNNINQVPQQFPAPTEGSTQIKEGSEDGDNQKKREEWFELMHQAAPGVNWRALEYQTQMQRHLERKESRNNASSRNNEEILANGNLIGEWRERGSRNQAGSVFVTEFDAQTEEIYLISAGGTLWKSNIQGTNWQVINQDFRFGEELLKFIPTDSGRRLIATIGEVPHYSDDDGLSWSAASGITINDSWGRSRNSVVLDDPNYSIYLLSKPSYWDNLKLYKSADKGETYQVIHQFTTYDMERFALCKPHGSDEVYLIDRHSGEKTSIFRIDQDNDELELLFTNETFGFGSGNARANLIGFEQSGDATLLIYNADDEVFETTDFGQNWSLRGQMPTRPWSVGIFMSPSDPDFLMYGEVECFISPHGGATWIKVNSWADYYNDIHHSLHADMMFFNEFQRSNGDNFLLISNHGGLSISYDYMNTRDNIGLNGLNVSQYYSVRTDPFNNSIVYAGSQDQGFQRGVTVGNHDVMIFDQVISGDYGHIVFSQNGSRLWTVYPGGWVTYYGNPHSGGISASYDLDSENETVWLPPLMSKPNSAANEIFMAGGNINGGAGSHIINLKVQGNNINASQFPFDFYAESAQGTVSALKTSPLNPDRWFVATTNGRFFTSDDNGQTWEQTINFVPEGHYLYGQTIYASKFDENTVYLGGSGYSNPAVWKSTNGGVTFAPMNEGLPPTLVFEITANQDESMLFAATEAGPFVYIVEEEVWYDMSGMAAPAQTYWSVEYVEAYDFVRFGTYGRGFWDFRISEPTATKELLAKQTNLKVFPNPANDLLQFELKGFNGKNISVSMANLQGAIIKEERMEIAGEQALQGSWNVSEIPRGIYVLTITDGEKNYSSKVSLQ